MVAKFITSAFIPIFVSELYASRASQTKCPFAIIVTSFPSVKISALPISNGFYDGVKFGTFGRPNLKYTGPE